jgi:hypothetical protein
MIYPNLNWNFDYLQTRPHDAAGLMPAERLELDLRQDTLPAVLGASVRIELHSAVFRRRRFGRLEQLLITKANRFDPRRHCAEGIDERFTNCVNALQTFLNVSQLAWPAMLVEIDVIAMVPLR